MTRQHQRWTATAFVFAAGGAAVAACHLGFATQRLLMFGWLAPLLAAAYAAGRSTGPTTDGTPGRIHESGFLAPFVARLSASGESVN